MNLDSFTHFLGRVSEWKGSYWMPEDASETVKSVDPTFYFIGIVTTVFFVVIVAIMLFFMIVYRKRREGERTSPVDGSHALEAFWAGVSTVLLFVMFFMGYKGYMELAIPPGDAMEVRVTGQKWFWTFDYPVQGLSVKATMDAQKAAAESGAEVGLVVPVGKNIKIVSSSVDVIHSFFVPAFRIKKDVIPNRYTVQWFNATKEGVYDVFCTEYCGTDHSRMVTKVIVKSQADFDAWVEKTKAESGGPVDGAKVFANNGCGACHATDASKKIGPGLGGLFGRDENIQGAGPTKVDDNYLRESIVNPTAKVVEGYAPVMPPFAGRINDAEMNALLDYIKGLK